LQVFGLFLAFKRKQVHVISFLFFLLIVLVIGAMPLWPYSRTWGFYPSGVVALTLSVLILLAISGRL
jgi:Protein of unknown function (DUF3309)